MKLDPIDLLILRELSEDGRASLRQIGRRVSLSTPTVSSRFERMKRAGLIQKFVPVLDLDASENIGIISIVTLSAPNSSVEKIARDLTRMNEVHGVYLTTGPENMIVKVRVPNARSLQRFLAGSNFKKLGAEVKESQIVTETFKDEQPLPIASELQMNLRCDLCKGEITTGRPYTIKVGATRYYFCCKTCRGEYLEKHGSRLRSLSKNLSIEA